MNDGKPALDARGSDLGVTIARSPIFAHHDPRIVDEAAAPPARETLLWYRLACALPQSLPPQSIQEGTSEEDAAAIAAANANPGTPFHGLRIKSLEAPTRRRAVRTLDLFLKEATITDGFVITLPKVTSVEQVEAMVLVLETLEQQYRREREHLATERDNKIARQRA